MPFGAAPPAPPCGGVGALLSAALQPGSSALELYVLPPQGGHHGDGHGSGYQHVIINY